MNIHRLGKLEILAGLKVSNNRYFPNFKISNENKLFSIMFVFIYYNFCLCFDEKRSLNWNEQFIHLLIATIACYDANNGMAFGLAIGFS